MEHQYMFFSGRVEPVPVRWIELYQRLHPRMRYVATYYHLEAALRAVTQDPRPHDYTRCDECDTYVRDIHSDIYRELGANICVGCARRLYTTCSDCGGWVSRDDLHSALSVCSACAEHYEQCESCGSYIRVGDECSCNEHGILKYGAHYALMPCPQSSSISDDVQRTGNRYFGVELELNFSADETADIVNYAASRVASVWMRDASIGDGAELITQPHTYSEWRKIGLKSLLAGLRKLGATSYDSGVCGLHVHVSNDGLTTDADAQQLIQWLDSNYEFLKRFSRREDYTYCDIAKGQPLDWWRASRYRAINFLPKRTFEFRIFRGTLNYARVLASIQLSLAAIDFVAAKKRLGYTTKLTFRAFLDSRSEYQYLVNYCKQQALYDFIC